MNDNANPAELYANYAFQQGKQHTELIHWKLFWDMFHTLYKIVAWDCKCL